MQFQPGSTAQLLWSHPVMTSMQKQAQGTSHLSLCSLSLVPKRGNRHNVAVLASAPDGALTLQLLSISPGVKPEELSTHMLSTANTEPPVHSKKDCKWHCCCGPELEVLIWRDGGKAHLWTADTGTHMWHHASTQQSSQFCSFVPGSWRVHCTIKQCSYVQCSYLGNKLMLYGLQ